MPNYLQNFGLGAVVGDKSLMKKLVNRVMAEGKVIKGYYGFSYYNKHMGDLQLIARVMENPIVGPIFLGLDTHCAGRSVWKARIIKEMERVNSDPLNMRLLLKDPESNTPYIADIVNADVLPSFTKNEVIELQMIAFTNRIRFFETEEDYRKTVLPGLNGVRTFIEDDALIPIGLHSEDEYPETRELVLIHGRVVDAFWGTVDLSGDGSDKRNSFIICRVRTQLGIIEIIEEAGVLGDEDFSHIHPGAIAECTACLSGDPAIHALDHGIVKSHENNLKLLGYTLSSGDADRIGSVLSDSFIYHSEVTGYTIENVGDFIEFLNMMRMEGSACRCDEAVLKEPADGETLEFPAGTRCLVLRYDGSDQYESLAFIENDEDENIRRILISEDTRYRFDVKTPPEEGPKIKEEMSVEEAMLDRAALYRLVPSYVTLEFVQKTLYANRFYFEDELAPFLSGRDILREDFGEAYLNGVENYSPIDHFDPEEIRRIGDMFFRVARHYIVGWDCDDQLRDALLFVMTLGSLYVGRLDEQPPRRDHEYMNINGIKAAFGEHLRKYRGYSDAEIKLAVHDFPNPYANPYLREEYEDEVEVDGILYQRYKDCVDFSVLDVEGVPPFSFYTLYCGEDVQDHKVIEFLKARKLFQI